jgi:two-component sensor histidine kinase
MLRTMTEPLGAWHRLRMHVTGTVAICLIVGLLLYLMNGRDPGLNLLYAFTIGVQISIYISALQYLVAARLRAQRPDDAAARYGWAGWRWTLPCALAGGLAGYSGGLWLGDLISGRHSSQPWQGNAGSALLTLSFTLLAALLGTLFFVSHFKLQALKLDQAQASAQAAEARLTLLQSQLEPHMLFNTLAHLRVLIKLRPDEAQAMLEQLIAYLRATLQASRATEHPLADEFARLADYLALMQLRMGSRLRVVLDLPPALARTPVPPLLLQPLVENAIKHGLEPHVDGGELRVSAVREAGQLRLEVADTGAGLTAVSEVAVASTGFGLSQVRERLAQRYGSRASFSLQARAGGGSIATITLPSP